MSPLLQLASQLPRPGLRRVLALALFLSAGSLVAAHAQSSPPALTPQPQATEPSPQGAPSVLPAAPSPSAPPALANFSSTPAQFRGRSMQNSYQPGPGFDSFTGASSFASPSGGSIGFTGAPGGFSSGPPAFAGFGAAPQGTGSFSPFRSAAMGGRPGASSPLFPAGDGPNLNNLFGQAQTGQPSLNQLLRGSYRLPVDSSTGFRLSYQGMYRPGPAFSETGLPSASALFTTSDLGNGVFLSAGTGYGSHSMAGAPAATLGNTSTPGARHSGPSVALKLSF